MMDPQQMQGQQRQMSPMMKAFLASLDGVIEEAVMSVIGELRERHVAWHKDMKNEPSGNCHTCVLVGIAAPQQPAAETPQNGAEQPQAVPTPIRPDEAVSGQPAAPQEA